MLALLENFTFRGRGDEIHVYPLSFSEFMQVYPGSRETGLQEYLLYGGLPFILSRKTRAEKMQYLKNLFTETYLKDIIARYSIQSQDTLDTILDIISSSIGSLVNTRRIGNTFKTVLNQSVSPTTINKYLDILEDAFLIRKVYRYDVRGRKYVGTPLKYYYEDTGLRNVRLNFRQIESTYLMENAVYMELCRRGFCVDVGMVDHRELDDSGKLLRKQYEIDFVANLGDVRIYIQSAFSIPNLDKYRQESKSLVLTNDSFSKLIVVLDMVPAHQTDDGILIVNLYDFLMDPSILNMARLMQ